MGFLMSYGTQMCKKIQRIKWVVMAAFCTQCEIPSQKTQWREYGNYEGKIYIFFRIKNTLWFLESLGTRMCKKKIKKMSGGAGCILQLV